MGKSNFHLRSLLIVVILAFIFSSLTLWLIESWIKFPLFIFEMLMIIVLYLVVSDYDVKIVMRFSRNINLGLIIDFFFIISAVSLLLSNLFHLNGGLVQPFLAILLTSLLPGYAILSIFEINRYFSRLENLVLSYLLSYTFTGLVTLVFLPVSQDIRSLVILVSFIFIGVVSAFKHRKIEPSPMVKSFSKSIDFIVLLLCLTFYALSYTFLYPGYALLPGEDIARHYANSINLWRTPELYSTFPNFLAHLHESAFIALSNAPVTVVQTTLVLLNLMMPIAFYIMAKNYMEGIDARLPAISTIFYATFSGFAWIYLARLKLEGVQGSTLSLLNMVNDKAYNGAMYLAQPFLWFVPLSMSFTILIVQLALLKKSNVSEKGFMALFSLLTIASFMVHVTEVIIFSLFISFYAFFSKGEGLRTHDVLKASIIGFMFLDISYTILQYVFARSLSFSIGTLFIPSAILIFVYAYRRLGIQDKLTKFLPRLAVKLLAIAIFYIAAFIYILGLVVWISGVPSFHTQAVSDIGSLPWFIYPARLGVTVMLTFVSFYYLLEDHNSMKQLMPFISLIVFSFVFGRVLTFINANFFDLGYWEKRFISYYFLASAVIAPFSIVKAEKSLNAHRNRFRNILLIVLMGTIVVWGIQSSFIVLEYWNTYTGSTYVVSEEELKAIDFLRGVMQQDKYAYTITLTSRSYDTLALAAPPYRWSKSWLIYTAKNPEIALLSLKAQNLSHAYLYMHIRDYEILDKNREGWMFNHLIPILPVIYKNEEVTIYNVSSVSFPKTNSTTALVIPFDSSIDPKKGVLYAYDVLSLGEYNYSVVYDLDPQIFQYKTIVLSFDPPTDNILKTNFQDDFSCKRGWTPISGTWQYTSNGLEAGKMDKYEDAIILAPIFAQNFTVSLDFKLISGDIKVPNYVWIIYDWEDQKNFKCVGLTFDSSKNVYAFILIYEGGRSLSYPSWPGLKTGFKWEPGNSYNLTVSVNEKTITLNVNNTQCLSVNGTADGGQIGIRVLRFYKVFFTKFKAQTSVQLRLRDIDEYLNYVKGGGQIIIFNTNGYGYFAERILRFDNSSIEACKIEGLQNLVFPVSVSVQTFTPKTEKLQVTANYKSQNNGSSVYAVTEMFGAGKIIYVNLYPLIEAIDRNNNKSMFYPLLGRFLQPIELKPEPFRYVPPEEVATFRKAEFFGDINVSTSSIIFPFNLDLKKVKITYTDGSAAMIINVTRLQLFNYNGVSIIASNLTLSEGEGFYSKLKFGGAVKVMFENNLTSILLVTDGNTVVFNDVKAITIEDSDQIDLYVRQPVIKAQGQALFEEFYSGDPIYQKTRTQGQNLKVDGAILLKVFLSDTYSRTSFDIVGKLERIPPLVAYDELSSLPEAVVWSITMVPIFLALILIFYRKNR